MKFVQPNRETISIKMDCLRCGKQFTWVGARTSFGNADPHCETCRAERVREKNRESNRRAAAKRAAEFPIIGDGGH